MGRVVALAAVAAVALVWGLRQEASGSTSGVRSQSIVSRVYVAGLVADWPLLEASLSTNSAFQGGATLVATSRGVSGTATLNGRAYPLQPAAGRGLEGFVGVGIFDSPTGSPIAVDVVLEDGSSQRMMLPFTVLRTEWTVDYIIIPPPQPGDPDPLDPALIIAEQNRLNAIYAGRTPERYWAGDWELPLAGPLVPCIVGRPCVSGFFGEQRSINGGPVGGHHGGTDFAANGGHPVLASNAGVVVLAERLVVRGNTVIVDHGGGVFSGYSHMSSLAVAPGELVTKGELLGGVGTTGLSTGNHLHWELGISGVLVDGLRWLDGTQGF